MHALKDNCLFCSIINKKISAKIILENEKVLAFHDINPVASIHALIIPKIHIDSVNKLDADNLEFFGHMVSMAKELGFKNNIDESGYRLVINTGPMAGQTIFHLHMHFMAGREFSWPPG